MLQALAHLNSCGSGEAKAKRQKASTTSFGEVDACGTRHHTQLGCHISQGDAGVCQVDSAQAGADDIELQADD